MFANLRFHFTTFAAAVASIICMACGSVDREPAWRGTIDTLANGAIVVRNPAVPLWQSDEGWNLREDIRIGSADAEGPQQFSMIVGLTVDAGGRIYVIDRQAMEIRVFGADGQFIRTIGRRGEGPGEFRGANGLTFSPSGQLWVFDPGNARYSVFDTTGTLVAEYRRLITSYRFISDGKFSADGYLMEDGIRRVSSSESEPILIRMQPDSVLAMRDSINLPNSQSETFVITRTRGGQIVGQMVMIIPFSVRLASFVDPRGYVWFGMPDQYRIWQRDFSGDSLRAVELEAERLPVSAEERNAAVEEIRQSAGEDAQLDWSRIPEVKPLFSRIIIDDQGYLWVQRSTADSTRAFDVFDPDLHYLGQLVTPVRIADYYPVVIRGSHIFAVATDELDVQYLVRIAIDGRPPPSLRAEH